MGTVSASLKSVVMTHPHVNKRRRTNKNQSTASLMELNDDCLLEIMSSLSIDDLSSVALCNRRLCKLRNHGSLDQTREGTVLIREGSSINSLLDAISLHDWNSIFSGNRTKLKIVGLWGMELPPQVASVIDPLDGVTSLKVSIKSSHNQQESLFRDADILSHLFPNLRELDLSYVPITGCPRVVLRAFSQRCPELARLIWNGNKRHIKLSGMEYQDLSHLSELFLDESTFSSAIMREIYAGSNPDYYMFWNCPGIKRLSIKDCRLYDTLAGTTSSLPQDILIKMVRHHPSIEWLRSDLSVENIAMLQQERPGMTFVSK